MFPTREAVGGYVAAFDVLGTRPVIELERVPEPFRATTRHAVFVAEKAA